MSKQVFDVALVDADCLVYRLGFAAASGGLDWPTTETIFRNYIELIRDNPTFESKDIHLCFTNSGKPNYRDQFDPEGLYKTSRKKKTGIKPLWIQEMRDLYYNDHMTYSISPSEGEADDLICIGANLFPYGTTVIISSDKDLLQIPGYHAPWLIGKKIDTTYSVSEIKGHFNFYSQLLTGDKADDIQGIKGIGPVRASNYLSHLKSEAEMFSTVLDVYNNAYKDTHSVDQIADMIYNRGNLLYLRKSTSDSWTPPTL